MNCLRLQPKVAERGFTNTMLAEILGPFLKPVRVNQKKK